MRSSGHVFAQKFVLWKTEAFFHPAYVNDLAQADFYFEYESEGCGMAAAIRNCAGGVVFSAEEIFLLKNDKGEWVLPKGVIRDKSVPREVALARVEAEAGIRAQIIAPAGDTRYEFYSQTRRKSVCNRIQWFAMTAESKSYRIAFEQGFLDGDYYPLARALELISHEQDADIIRKAWEIYQQSKS